MSKDTIYRQAAMDAFDGVKVDEENCTEYDIGYNDGIDFAVSSLSVLPSAQPEIVRCKDCKHWDTEWSVSESGAHYCPVIDGNRNSDFYCADAERRTDERTD